MDIAHGVQELGHLALPSPNDRGIGMASGRDTKGGCQVQVLLTVDIPNEVALSTFPNNRPGPIWIDKRDIPGLKLVQQPEDGLCAKRHQSLGLHLQNVTVKRCGHPVAR